MSLTSPAPRRDSPLVRLPGGRTLDLARSRWDGTLDAEEFEFCRHHGIALAYDCAQSGWVVDGCADPDAVSPSPPIAVHTAAAPTVTAAPDRPPGPGAAPPGTRIEFRRWTPDDVDDYVALLGDPRVWEHMPEPYPDPFTAETARTLIEVAALEFHHDAVAVLVDGRPVGQCLLRFDTPVAGVRSAEVAYWLGAPHWGKGWMSRILPVFTTRSFELHGVDEIYAWISPANPASIRVAERAGYARDDSEQVPQLAERLSRPGWQRFVRHRDGADLGAARKHHAQHLASR